MHGGHRRRLSRTQEGGDGRPHRQSGFGLQCLLNWANDGHYDDWLGLGCTIEAFAHVSAIQEQFLAIWLIARRNYADLKGTVDKFTNNSTLRQQRRRNAVAPAPDDGKTVSTTTPPRVSPRRAAATTSVEESATQSTDGWTVKRAIGLVALTWLVAESGTVLAASFSPVVVMPVGAYCFYGFTSPVIVLWFAPVMLLTVVHTAVLYRRIHVLVKEYNATRAGEDGHQSLQGQLPVTRLAFRSFVIVLAYLIGWLPAVLTSGYALFTGHVTAFWDTFLAIFGSFHSVWQPLIYGWFNHNVRKCLFACCPALLSPYFRNLRTARVRGRETVLTGRGSGDTTNQTALHPCIVVCFCCCRCCCNQQGAKPTQRKAPLTNNNNNDDIQHLRRHAKNKGSSHVYPSPWQTKTQQSARVLPQEPEPQQPPTWILTPSSPGASYLASPTAASRVLRISPPVSLLVQQPGAATGVSSSGGASPVASSPQTEQPPSRVAWTVAS